MGLFLGGAVVLGGGLLLADSFSGVAPGGGLTPPEPDSGRRVSPLGGNPPRGYPGDPPLRNVLATRTDIQPGHCILDKYVLVVGGIHFPLYCHGTHISIGGIRSLGGHRHLVEGLVESQPHKAVLLGGHIHHLRVLLPQLLVERVVVSDGGLLEVDSGGHGGLVDGLGQQIRVEDQACQFLAALGVPRPQKLPESQVGVVLSVDVLLDDLLLQVWNLWELRKQLQEHCGGDVVHF